MEKETVPNLEGAFIRASLAGEMLRKEMVRISKPKKQEFHGIKTDRQLVELGIRSPKIYPNYEYSKKLIVEKKMLKRLRSEHKQKLILNGFNPKKRMNLSDPQTVKFTC
jgi:hypothetical protein